MHMPGRPTGTTKRVARILPEGGTDESATNRQIQDAGDMRKRDSSAVRPAGMGATLSALIGRPYWPPLLAALIDRLY
jgi:hypothetical protein